MRAAVLTLVVLVAAGCADGRLTLSDLVGGAFCLNGHKVFLSCYDIGSIEGFRILAQYDPRTEGQMDIRCELDAQSQECDCGVGGLYVWRSAGMCTVAATNDGLTIKGDLWTPCDTEGFHGECE